MLSGFWRLRLRGWERVVAGGRGGWVNLLKKGKFVTRIFFSDNVELSSKNLSKMISADVKANIKQEIKGSGGCILQIFMTSKYLQTLKYNVKKVCVFHVIFHPSCYCLCWVAGGGLLNGQNLLSVTKFICQQSLNR